MRKNWTILLVAVALLAGSCKNDKVDEAVVEETTPSISGDARVETSEFIGDAPAIESLEYQRIVEEVFQNTGEPAEWDGVPNLASGRSYLSVSMGQSCGEGGCGKVVFLENAHPELAVQTVVTIPFQVEGSPGYIARQYQVPAGAKISLGCSHLCDGTEKIDFRRAIVVALLLQKQPEG